MGQQIDLRILGAILALVLVMSVLIWLEKSSGDEGVSQDTPEVGTGEDNNSEKINGELFDDGPMDRLNRLFIKYSKHHFGIGFDWRWFKAQGICESNLDSTARSFCHAQGIMQILPSTFADMRRRDPGIEDDIRSARWNIAAGIAYDRMLFDLPYVRSELGNRLRLMFACYNGGMGNVNKAVLLCGNNRWECVRFVAYRVPGWRHEETVRYVERIVEVHALMR